MTTHPAPRWLLTCSCGYERESISQWTATAAVRLHIQHLGDKSLRHRITIKDPPQDQPPARTQLGLP